MYSLIILLILLFTMILKKETFRFSSRILKTLIILVSVQMVIEILSWSFDTINKPYARVLNYGFNLLFFLFGAVIVGVFFCYVDYLLNHSKEQLRKRFYYMHLLILFIILAIINFFTPVVFSISESNVYQREFLMNFAFIAVFFKLLNILFLVWKNRNRLENNVFLSVFTFGALPLIGGLLQMIFFGLLIMWAFVGLSVIIAYIFTETFNSSKDYLTKLYTREISDEYILQLLDSRKDAMAILFDIDNLKLFNDQFGHSEGDKALIIFSKALIASFPRTALISRFGGDEFLVAFKDNQENNHQLFLHQLNEYIHDIKIENYQLTYSYGVASTKSEDINDLKSLIHACDKRMYEQKSLHKTINHKK